MLCISHFLQHNIKHIYLSTQGTSLRSQTQNYNVRERERERERESRYPCYYQNMSIVLSGKKCMNQSIAIMIIIALIIKYKLFETQNVVSIAIYCKVLQALNMQIYSILNILFGYPIFKLTSKY